MSDGSIAACRWTRRNFAVPTEYQSPERLCATNQWLSGYPDTGRIAAAAGRKSGSRKLAVTYAITELDYKSWHLRSNAAESAGAAGTLPFLNSDARSS